MKISTPEDDHHEDKCKLRKEQNDAKDLLERAHDILKEADESYIANNTGPRRRYPTFDVCEIQIGPLLGVGGFCQVFEIKEFRLNELEQIQEEGDETNESSTLNTKDESSAPSKGATKRGDKRVDSSLMNDDDTHYDIRSARTTMARLVRRNGSARYAIKRLHEDLNEIERARGIVDLALEAKYLSVLWHPNISKYRLLRMRGSSDGRLTIPCQVKMRAIASGSSLDPKFCIIMDRLYDILDHRFEKWVVTKQRNKGGLFGRGANRERLHELLVERLTVAYDLASALCYMHEHHLVYRDLKKVRLFCGRSKAERK
jgi:serine/threonine protein kinase